MSVTFEKAPLIELIVELRWVPQQVALQPGKTSIQGPQQALLLPVPFLGSSKLDEFFMRLGGKLHQHGFQAVERLMPPGFTILHQPVYRYRKAPDPSTSPVLCQAGDGLFSVHGLPPYHSWSKFYPVAEKGIIALLEARDSEQRDLPFANVTLRYIDAFTPELRGDRTASEFISSVLGISVSLPSPLQQIIKSGASPEYALQIGLPTPNDTRLTLNLGEASVNGVPSVLMDTTCAYTEGVVPDMQKIKQVLQSSYTIIHEMFLGLTKPIHDLMNPKETDRQ